MNLAPARLLLCLAVAARTSPAQSALRIPGVDSALRHFTLLVSRMANDSIAAMYLPDGVLVAPGRPPIVGPAAISAYLGTFSGYQVVAYRTLADSLQLRGDTAVQVGRWWQRVRVPVGDTVVVSGGFAAEWVRTAAGGWRLRRMATMSRDAGPWPARPPAR